MTSTQFASLSRGRRLRNDLATALMWLALLVALIPLVFVIYYVGRQGLKVLGWRFLTTNIPVRQQVPGPGMGPAVVGTVLITALATLIAVPLGILGAVYIVEYGADNRLARVIRFLGDVMAGVPSIVMGLFVYTIWVVRVHHFTGFAGSLALACLMLPIVIRSSESMLRLVPRDLREASFALGSSRSRTILTVVLPAAASGIVSGCLLAVARAAGETAPLLFTVGLTSKLNTNLFRNQNTSLSLQIFSNATQPFAGAQQRAWGAALTLMIIVLVFSIAARLVSGRLQRASR
ncbi:MAG: phosphate ABC transporter permease PstA [Acidimicrobiales bacterium]